ncbi:MAG: primase-helicase family protein [Verrucomicrobiota bacterium]
MKNDNSTKTKPAPKGKATTATPARAGVFKAEAKKPELPERVSQAGAIRIENEDALRVVPLFYYAERGQWFFTDGKGSFTKISDAQAKTIVAEYGFNKNAKDGQGNTPAERAMIWLMQNKRVAFAGALAGYPAGVHESGGIRFLVTESPVFITPKPGKCDTIRLLVESLFFDAEASPEDQRRQIVCFYLWASESFAAFYRRVAEGETDKFRHCPALAIFGRRLCGKSVLIDLIIAPLFGGRKADPMNYLRDPKFNKDLFAASLLVLDDKGASANLAERRQRGEGIKDMIWKAEQRMEGKGVDAVNLRPFWRLVIAGNDDDAGLQVCPALSPSLEDKILILRAQQAEGLPQTHEERDEWAARIRAELPAFAAYLLAWRPPEGLTLDPRTRVMNFWHPKIVSALRDLQPEMRFLELIDTLGLIDEGAPLLEGQAMDFEKAMRAKDSEGMLNKIFTGLSTTGRMLAELERIRPDRVKRTDRDGRSHYRIFPPKKKENQ